MKRKNILLAASLFGSVAIVSTGFATWVITGNATDSAKGQFTVEQVTDNRDELVASISDNSVTFGKPTNYSDNDGTPDWLTNNGATEDLVASVTISTFKLGGVDATPTLNSNLVVNVSTENATFNSLKSAGYLAKPSVSLEGNLVTITFNWGEKLNYKNPVEYFNKTYSKHDTKLGDSFETVTLYGKSISSTSTAADYAHALLSDLYNVNTANFTVTLTTKVPSGS